MAKKKNWTVKMYERLHYETDAAIKVFSALFHARQEAINSFNEEARRVFHLPDEDKSSCISHLHSLAMDANLAMGACAVQQEKSISAYMAELIHMSKHGCDGEG
jgi:hypothetical protein